MLQREITFYPMNMNWPVQRRRYGQRWRL